MSLGLQILSVFGEPVASKEGCIALIKSEPDLPEVEIEFRVSEDDDNIGAAGAVGSSEGGADSVEAPPRPPKNRSKDDENAGGGDGADDEGARLHSGSSPRASATLHNVMNKSSWAPGDIVTVTIPRGAAGIGMKLLEDDGAVFVTKTVKGSTSEQVLGSTKALGPNGIQILRVFGSDFVGKSECVELIKSQPDNSVELELRVLEGYGDDGGGGGDAVPDIDAEERQRCVKILSEVHALR